MPLTDGQVQVRDLVMGCDTDYRIVEFDPWSRRNRADAGGPRAWSHGSWSGAEWRDEAVVPIRVLIQQPTEASWLTRLQDLQAAFAPIGDTITDVELRFATGGAEYTMFGRPRMAEQDVATVKPRYGRSWTSCAFIALDPFVYSAEETVVGPINRPVILGGLTVPFSLPTPIPAVSTGGSATIVNSGTAPTGMRWTLDGPLTDPFVTLEVAGADNATLHVTTTLEAGHQLVIDTAARTVMLGTQSYRNRVNGTFPLLPPGSHVLKLRGLSGSGTLTSTHRSAWW